MHLITPLPISTLKPGSAVKPFPNCQGGCRDDEGRSIVGGGGHLVINLHGHQCSEHFIKTR